MTDLANTSPRGKKHNLFLLCHLNSLVYCYNLVRRDLNLIQLSSIIHYIDIMTISETKEQAKNDLNAMVAHDQPGPVNKSSKDLRACPNSAILRNNLSRSHQGYSTTD